MIAPATSLSAGFFGLAALLGVMFIVAVAADIDAKLRDQHRPQESHADLGENFGEPVYDYDRPRRTPTTRKAPPVAPSEARIRNTASQQH
ncbi:hypothetical protein [Tsukamurella sp. NPDC003166]|uniref:hypothetical protein n=1 Tax=Tsukamurella sp. NPDC003166 TaxID=3154444 RepID=UPI0033B42783